MRLLAILVMALSLAACGGAPGGGVGASPTPSEVPLPSFPASGFDVLVTDQDRAVAVHAGQRLEVFLRTRPGMTDWSGVNVDDTSVLYPTPTGIVAPRGVTIAGFAARRPGAATITAYASPRCAPGQACPAYAMLFSVRVTVTEF